MCGRFTLHHSTETLVEHFGVDQTAVAFEPRYNIAPTQPVAVIVQQQQKNMEAFRWGLVPFWAKDIKIGSRMINARAETLAQKPVFRAAFKRRRCLIPTSGFYEWQRQGKEKKPIYIRLAGEQPFAFAGLWEEWHGPNAEVLHSCSIVTTQANAFMAPIHQRMPVIFEPGQENIWLDPTIEDPQTLDSLLRPYEGAMEAHPVSTQVNIPTFDDPVCIQPAA
jgi:putative SOS response-associated peptidase YedK